MVPERQLVYDLSRVAKDRISGIKYKVEDINNIDIKLLEEKLIESGATYKLGKGSENTN